MKDKYTWIVIIDNGQSYSDNCHWVGCVCETEGQADQAVLAFNVWKEKVLAARKKGEASEIIRVAFPCPLEWEGEWIYDITWGLNRHTATPAKTLVWKGKS